MNQQAPIGAFSFEHEEVTDPGRRRSLSTGQDIILPLIQPILDWLTIPEIEEVAINRPGEMWLRLRKAENGRLWIAKRMPELDMDRMRLIVYTLANLSDTPRFGPRGNPVTFGTLPGGHRYAAAIGSNVQFVQGELDPEGTVVFCSRQNSPDRQIRMKDYGLELGREIGGMDAATQRKFDSADPWTRLMMSIERGDHILVSGATGCHARGAEILMADGTTKPVEDVIVGDDLMGPDSTPRRVLELRRGRQEMVRITPVNGEPFVVNLDHVLHLRRTRRRNTKPDVKAGSCTDVTVREYLAWPPFRKHLHKLVRVGVEHPHVELPIEPYFLGVWLGDGHSDGPRITTMDPEIVAACEEAGASYGLPVRALGAKNTGLADTYHIGVTDEERRAWRRPHAEFKSRRWVNPPEIPLGPWRSPIIRDLKALGIFRAKDIPDVYLRSSRAQRLALLAGLLDTDGSLWRNCFEITQKREGLARRIVRLARSLGFRASLTPKSVEQTTYWRVYISGDLDQVPTRLFRKQAAPRAQKKNPALTGFSTELLPIDDFFGFLLSSDHLYLTSDHIVHHNSGKTTLLNHIISMLQETLRIVSVEDTSELKIPQRNHVHILMNRSGQSNEFTYKSVVDLIVRMTPDVVMAGEISTQNAATIWELMRSGHGHFMTTIHAETAREAVSTFITRISHSSPGETTDRAALAAQMREKMRIVQINRSEEDGKRRVTEVI